MNAESIKLKNKKLVWDFLHGIAADNVEKRIAHCLAPQVNWQGPHPINTIHSPFLILAAAQLALRASMRKQARMVSELHSKYYFFDA